jgi:nucleoid-associated protein YgaU
MSLQAKYNEVLELGQALGIQNGSVTEENGVLNVGGVAPTQYEKDQIWNKIKEVGGANANDIIANISVADTSVYTRHIVKKGESLSLIAKHYCGDMMKYQAIFEANRDILKSADSIEVGQVLVIPQLV